MSHRHSPSRHRDGHRHRGLRLRFRRPETRERWNRPSWLRRPRESGGRDKAALRAYVPALIALAVGALLLGAAATVPVGRAAPGPDSGRADAVVIDGVRCRPRANLKTWLILGIDDTGETTDLYRYGGQADVLLLLVTDKVHGTYQKLAINRNTLAEVHSYGEDGEDLGTSRVQISYAHMAFDGGAQSCENTVRAVSDLLLGQRIDGYVAMGMDSVGELNRLAGGVRVTVMDDFSQEDPSLVLGQSVQLTDEQAEHFVRARMNVGDGSNESRMRRQEAFLEGLREALSHRAQEDEHFPLQAYDTMKPFLTTDLTEQDFVDLAGVLTGGKDEGTVRIEGTIGVDELEQATFEPDESALAQAVIDLFYTREE